MSDDASPKRDASVRSARRRPHRKSKTGCADCRRRRVKCDEKRPICSACFRRERSCDYPFVDDEGNGGQSPVLTTSSTRSRTSELPEPYFQPDATSSDALCHFLNIPVDSDPQLDETAVVYNLNDLALLHHWSFNVSSTICLADGEIDLWRRVFPEVGFEYPFVTHAILSVSALHRGHLSDLSQKGRYTSRAVWHHNAGLNGFRHAVASITAENSEALFIWSFLNLIYVFGIYEQSPFPSTASSTDLILGAQWIPMMHGVGTVLRPMYEFLRGGRLRTLVTLGNWDELDLDSFSGDPFNSQLCRVQQLWQDTADAATYDESMQVLRRCRRFVAQFDDMNEADLAQWGYNRAWSGPSIFIGIAPEAYFKLLRQRQPPSLILFAFFGAMLHEIRYFWFIRDLGKKIVRVIEDILGPYWRPWIAWPVQCVRDEAT